MDYSHARAFIAGHRGLVGSAIARAFERRGYAQPITRDRHSLDLQDQRAVRTFFVQERPELVLLAAAHVGGIRANDRFRWDFLANNLEIQTNVLRAALDFGTERLVFLGSSCIYPREAPQPIREDYLLTGSLEPTNEPYAVAKIAGVKLVEAAAVQHQRKWLSLMPTNLYGPGDNFELETSHVVPALLRKFHAAAQSGPAATVTLWGDGTPRREFLHVDDLAAATIHLLENEAVGLFNVGYGSDITIAQLADEIAVVTGFRGRVCWDTSFPNGTMRKLLDSTRIRATGWRPRISLSDGLRSTFAWYQGTQGGMAVSHQA